MRDHTPREQALFDVRYAAVRRWALGIESAAPNQLLFARARVDAKAATTRMRQDLVYKMVIVEPSGDVPHHILGDTVWGVVRDEMRITPGVFYAHATAQWASLYAGTLPTDYRRAVVAPGPVIEPSMVSDTEIPGDYRNVPDSDVMRFLSADGGRVIPLSEIPDPYPPLSFPDFNLELSGASVIHRLESVGGKPPLTYTLVQAPTPLAARVIGTDRLRVVRGSAPAGDYTGKVRVASSLGAVATATFTITVTPENP